jgi:hypothetical protein
MAVVVQCLNTSGTLVLDLNTGGYEAVVLPGSDATWRRQVVTSPFVDGNHEVSSVLDGMVMEVQVRVRGSSWVQVEQRRAALHAATQAPRWLLRISQGGVGEVWRADRADSTSPAPTYAVQNLRRDVYLRIPVQPTPAISGL